jgi:hypothetical protein
VDGGLLGGGSLNFREIKTTMPDQELNVVRYGFPEKISKGQVTCFCDV